LAVSGNRLVIGCRDPLDQQDVWVCLDTQNGEQLWRLSYDAPGALDYGNAPRATPVLQGDYAWLAGAHGHLHCVKVDSGEVVWNTNLAEQFAAEPRTWGHAGTPLIIDEMLIAQPGGKLGSLVALNSKTGELIWKALGTAAGHASPVLWRPQGKRAQIVAFDEKSLGGWDLESGRRLWTVVPKEPGDFNVPTPLVFHDRIVLSTESNGTRLLSVSDVEPSRQPTATYEKLSPDSHSPVVAAERLFGVHNGLHCLDLNNQLKPIWTVKDRAFQGKYASIVATDERILVVTFRGELILFDATANKYQELGRLPLTDDKRIQCWSHPALAAKKLYMRLNENVVCLPLE
jgi:outer membrane protein assembly factor BamB